MKKTLLRGTNIKDGKSILNGEINNITWWSNNYETVEHYYEGCVIELTIDIHEEDRMEYLIESTINENYTFGYSEMLYPEGAIWYSISSRYIKTHVVSIKEINIDDICK